jgi:hypothetical protein
MGFHGDGTGKSPVHVLVSGPLAPLADDLCKELSCRGYTPRSTNDYLRLVSRLSRWLESRNLSADGLTAAVVEEFFQLRKAQGHRRWLTSRSVSVLLACMRIERATDGLAAGAPFEALLVTYREYLRAERGLAAGTVAQYLRHARVFLSWLPTPVEAGLARLSAEQVTHGLVPRARCGGRQDDGDRAAVLTAFPARDRAGERPAGERGAVGARVAQSPSAAEGRRQPAGPGAGRV